MRGTRILLAAAVAVAGFAMTGVQASHHCRDVFVLSGQQTPADSTAGYRAGGVNIGSATCTVRRSGTVDLPSVNYLTPGATHAWVAVGFNTQPETGAAPSGTAKIGNGGNITLTWIKNTARGRWESQALPLGNATTMQATVTVAVPSDGLSASQTVTYNRAA